MSLNYDSGYPIAIIKDRTNQTKKKNKVIYVNDKKNKYGADEIELTKYYESDDSDDDKPYYQIIPNKNCERPLTLGVLGPSGSGKSYFCGQVIAEYSKMFKNHPVILFSDKETVDSSLGDIPNLKRVKISTDLLDEDADYFADIRDNEAPCLVIYDDIDSIMPVKLKKYVYQLVAKTLKVGRDIGISCIVTNHKLKGHKETEAILEECKFITVFPRNWDIKMEAFCKDYLGLSKDEMKKVRKSEGRATTLAKTYPHVIIQTDRIFTKGLDY
jgi:hypothetical protein